MCHQGEMLLQFQSTKKISIKFSTKKMCIIYHDNHQNNEGISTHSSVHLLGFMRNSIMVLSATMRRTLDSVQFSRSVVSNSATP